MKKKVRGEREGLIWLEILRSEGVTVTIQLKLDVQKQAGEFS